MTEASDKAAKRFFNTLLPEVGFDYTDHKAKPLIRAAFALYEAEWRVPGQTWRISEWMWPFDQLHRKEGPEFKGDEPWTILLRRAVDMACAKAQEDGTPAALIRTYKARKVYTVELDLSHDGKPARTRCIGSDQTEAESKLIERAAFAALLLAGYAVSTKHATLA